MIFKSFFLWIKSLFAGISNHLQKPQEIHTESASINNEDATDYIIEEETEKDTDIIHMEKIVEIPEIEKINTADNDVKLGSEKDSKDLKELRKSCYTNRELSWLQFNERVLNEAGNNRVPLAERLNFAHIFQTNLDEFFMVRVGTLMVQLRSKKKIRDNKTNMSSKAQIKAILKQVNVLEEKKAGIYNNLMAEIEEQGISLVNFNKLTTREAKLLEVYFDTQISPYLSPMIVGNQQPFPFLPNGEQFAVVSLTNDKNKPKLGLVDCTNSAFKRLIEIPGRKGAYILSEKLILQFVGKLYPKYTILEKALLRISRNADIEGLEVLDEDMDYRDMMSQLIKKRKRLKPVRAELNKKISDSLKETLSEYLKLNTDHFIVVKTPLELSYVSQIQDLLRDKPNLFYEKRAPQLSPEINMNDNILNQIEKKDILLSYPFESINPFLKMLRDAAEDPSVVSIKMTLYRVASRSQVVEALIEAAENGKEVEALMELRARFDEANNIEMSQRLEEAGVNILYGLEDYKVHSKLCLITRKTEDGFEYITQIGTGNYNEKTSRLYTDLSLMTANQQIGAEAAMVFDALQKGQTVTDVKELLVAPNCLQNRIVDMIDEQIAISLSGKPAYVGVKVNSLSDKLLIDKLIEASQVGVKVDLIVRGICCLKPHVPGFTDNIRVVSVVGRFLEHSRIYRFGIGEEEKQYIASADFMTRNTIHRVEVAVPVYDENNRNKIRHMFDTIMIDDEKGKEQNSEGKYLDRKINEVPVNSQELFYQEAYGNAGKE